MKTFFKQIPTMKSKTLSHDKKYKKPLADIGGGLYMEIYFQLKNHKRNMIQLN